MIAGGARIETDYVRELRARAGRAAIPVRLLGMVPPETVEELYAGARVHLAPSFQEGQPLTVLEAMSHGCCIVASDIPAHIEVLDDAGLLYAVKDPDALAAALRLVLADTDLRRDLGAEHGTRSSTVTSCRGIAPRSRPKPCSSRWCTTGDDRLHHRVASLAGRPRA